MSVTVTVNARMSSPRTAGPLGITFNTAHDDSNEPPLNVHSLPSTPFVPQHRPTTLNHTPVPRPLNFEAASNRLVFPSTSRRAIPRPLPNPAGAGHVPIAAALPSPPLVIPPPQPSAAASYPTPKTGSASPPSARKRPLPGPPPRAEDALTSPKPALTTLAIPPSEPRKQRHDIFASVIPPPRRGRLPEEESLLTLSPISPASDPDSVLQHELWERATLVNGHAGSHPREFDLATLDDDDSATGVHPMEQRRGRSAKQARSSSGSIDRHPLISMLSPVSPLTPSGVLGVLGPEEASPLPSPSISIEPPLRQTSHWTPLPTPVSAGASSTEPLLDHEDDVDDKDGSSSVRSLSPIRYARPPSPRRREYETGTSSPIWEPTSNKWEDRISPLHFSQMDSDQSGDESDDVTEEGGRRSVSLDSHVQRPGRQRVGSDDSKASSSATPRSSPSRRASPPRVGALQAEMSRRNRTLSPSALPNRQAGGRAVSPKGLALQSTTIGVGLNGQLVLRSPPPNVTSFSRGRNGPSSVPPSSSSARVLATGARSTTQAPASRTRGSTVTERRDPLHIAGFPPTTRALPIASGASSTPSTPALPSTGPSFGLITPIQKRTHFRKSLSVDSIDPPHPLPSLPPAKTFPASSSRPTSSLIVRAPAIESSQAVETESVPVVPALSQETPPILRVNSIAASITGVIASTVPTSQSSTAPVIAGSSITPANATASSSSTAKRPGGPPIASVPMSAMRSPPSSRPTSMSLASTSTPSTVPPPPLPSSSSKPMTTGIQAAATLPLIGSVTSPSAASSGVRRSTSMQRPRNHPGLSIGAPTSTATSRVRGTARSAPRAASSSASSRQMMTLKPVSNLNSQWATKATVFHSPPRA